MNKSKDYEYYCTRAHHLPVKQTTVSLTRGLKLCPKYAYQIYSSFATNHNNLKQYSKSAIQLRKALIIEPEYPQGWQSLATVFFADGKFDESVTISKKALQMSPALASIHVTLIKALENLGRLDELSSIYLEIGEDVPQNWIAKLYKASVKKLVKDKKSQYALQCLRRAFDIWPDNYDLRVEYGKLLQHEGFLQEALKEFEFAQRLEPLNFDVRFRIPNLKYDLMMVEEAIEDLKGILDKGLAVDDCVYFDFALMLYHFYGDVEMIEPYKENVESYLSFQGYDHSKNDEIKRIQLDLESETDEKKRGFLTKKLHALRFILDWVK